MTNGGPILDKLDSVVLLSHMAFPGEMIIIRSVLSQWKWLGVFLLSPVTFLSRLSWLQREDVGVFD